MVPFESLHAVSYLPSVVTVALSCVSSEIKPDIGRKSRFFIPSLHFTPPLGGGFPSEYCHPVWCGKTRMAGLPDGEKNSPRYAYASRSKNRPQNSKLPGDSQWPAPACGTTFNSMSHLHSHSWYSRLFSSLVSTRTS